MANTNKSLILHTGAVVATREEVDAVPTPMAEGTYHPIAHGRLIDQVYNSLEGMGYEVTNEKLGLYREGQRLFGTFDLTMPGKDGQEYTMVGGIRNSHDKSFAAGLAVGNRVFVCDNLSFSGEVRFQRKHTTFIDRDLPGVVARALGRLETLHTRQETRIEAYRNSEVGGQMVLHDLLVRSMDARIIVGSALPKVLNEFRNPSFEEFKDKSVWSLFNAYTFIMKSYNAAEVATRTEKLHALLDSFIKLELPKLDDADVIEGDATITEE